ncbi:MAG: hypothetical protein J6Q43_00895 [Bacteroidaceae bacterium]|nr:hypothetical protein [Bacteroidaceae bacterium]
MSKEQARMIRRCGLHPFFYAVMDECRDFLMIRHRITGERKLLLKEGMKKAAPELEPPKAASQKYDGAILAQKERVRND